MVITLSGYSIPSEEGLHDSFLILVFAFVNTPLTLLVLTNNMYLPK